jgi:tRNA pseudouridine32 synthase/23S rRNA pseudouridine746 synthase/23S rRNA pseudouridine1911/1915/1917 synthase
LHHVVGGDSAGSTLKELLREELGISGRRIQRLSRSKGFRVNGKASWLARRLRPGDRVSVRVGEASRAATRSGPRPAETGAIAEIPIQYEDADFLVVNKPPGLPCHAAGSRPDLLGALGEQVGGALHLVHRLDRWTSGLLLVARSAHAHHRADRLLRQRRLRRKYLAVIEGRPTSERAVVDAPIAVDPQHRRRRIVAEGGKPSRTECRLLGSGKEHSLLSVELSTGRTHQIRVHLAHWGHPVVGDPLYGHPDPRIGRPALHAHELSCDHPTGGGAPLAETAPPPQDYLSLMEALGLAWPPRAGEDLDPSGPRE